MKVWASLLLLAVVVVAALGMVQANDGVSMDPENGTPQSQIDALVALYNATNGPQWSPIQWNIDSDPCLNAWQGIKCDQYNNVYTVTLQKNNLVGTIPSEIENLPALQFFFLSGNNLTGSIPASIGALVGLQQIGFDSNELSGSIPSSFSKLTNLQSLFLQSNQLQVFSCVFSKERNQVSPC